MAKEKKENKAVLWLQKNPFWACVIVLSTIAVIAGLLLGGVNELTYLSPAEKLTRNLNKAYKIEYGWEELDTSAISITSNDKNTKITAVYVPAIITTDEEGNVLTSERTLVDGKDVYIYTTTSKGFKSGLEFMIVVEDNKIINIMKTASSETNSVEKKEKLLGQFKNIDITSIDGFKNAKTTNGIGKDIDAVSGSTKTSNAVINTMDLVVKYHKAIVGGAK